VCSDVIEHIFDILSVRLKRVLVYLYLLVTTGSKTVISGNVFHVNIDQTWFVEL